MRVYKDGLLAAEAETHHTSPIQPNGDLNSSRPAFDRLRLTPAGTAALIECVTLSLSKGDARAVARRSQ